MRGAVIVGWLVALLALMGVVLGPLWVWFWWRIEPPTGQVAVLIRKTGKDLSQDRLLALEPGEKGVQLEVLPEGRHWRNPYTWDWLLVPIIDIPAGRLGVQVRLYGQDPPPGQIIATEGQRGILGEVLGPGKYRVNPYAYEIRILDAVSIKPGCVGVVTSLVGQDILTGPEQTPAVNEFLVGPGSKGVVPEVKDPGTYYLNPYVFNVVEVNLQSQRFEMSGEDAITFLAQDGFTVRAEGTIEFCLMRDKAAKLTHQVGDIDDILQKIILPRTRGFSRIEGSKKPAVDFIAGETRQAFQDNLQKHLTETCEPWGIAVNSVLIRNIIPPEGIAQLIRDREIAVQEARKFEQQITQAKSKAELVRQETLAEQNRKKVEADTTKLKAVIEAKQRVAVNIIGGERDLEVAKIEALAAKAKAGAQTVEAEAKRDVVRLANDAEAAVLAQKAKAFSGGEAYARYLLMTTLAPRLQSVLASDQAGGVADILAPPAVLPGKEVPR
jgi:regulator of protease activity HflC (stomatin/prohibitin superfamily)